mmetsp:Transcript_3312/g.6182  ORF Transcript_3312/g.6182 Transcript_3312/m.6182 type:complete len:261 (+) Transcript_3312:34-816(+)
MAKVHSSSAKKPLDNERILEGLLSKRPLELQNLLKGCPTPPRRTVMSSQIRKELGLQYLPQPTGASRSTVTAAQDSSNRKEVVSKEDGPKYTASVSKRSGSKGKLPSFPRNGKSDVSMRQKIQSHPFAFLADSACSIESEIDPYSEFKKPLEFPSSPSNAVHDGVLGQHFTGADSLQDVSEEKKSLQDEEAADILLMFAPAAAASQGTKRKRAARRSESDTTLSVNTAKAESALLQSLSPQQRKKQNRMTDYHVRTFFSF